MEIEYPDIVGTLAQFPESTIKCVKAYAKATAAINLRAAEARAKRPAPCENLCEARAFEIEIRGLKAELIRAKTCIENTMAVESELRAENKQLRQRIADAENQKPMARGYKNSTTGTGVDLHFLGDVPEGETYLYARPIPQSRITEQDAREIAASVSDFINCQKRLNGYNVSVSFDDWYVQTGLQLLDKLNADRIAVSVYALSEEKLKAAYWDFDARVKGLPPYKVPCGQPEHAFIVAVLLKLGAWKEFKFNDMPAMLSASPEPEAEGGAE